MFLILGGTGNVGGALARLLLGRGLRVTVVTRSASKRVAWERRGARVAVLDVADVSALRRVFREHRRAFLLNPPAAPDTDTDAQERKTAAAIAAAVEDSGLERVVLESTYGARPGRQIGDMGVLYELEQMLGAGSVPLSVIRAAYYMSNWDMQLESARQEGRIQSLLPAGFKLPMVAPHDIAVVAARLLTDASALPGPHYVEGPEPYAPADVARALEHGLGRPVRVESVPESGWPALLRSGGFSAAAADSMAAMTRIVVQEQVERPAAPERGTTTLEQYLRERLPSSAEES